MKTVFAPFLQSIRWIYFPFRQKREASLLPVEPAADASLVNDLQHTKHMIDTLLLHLDYQTDPDLIDCYTYQLKGAYMQYRFLLKKIQQAAQ